MTNDPPTKPPKQDPDNASTWPPPEQEVVEPDKGARFHGILAPKDTRIVLMRSGSVARLKKKGPMYHGKQPGAYSPTGAARFWNPRAIPAGWLTVYPEGDPDPVGEADPQGWDARKVEQTVGDYVLHIMHGGLKTRHQIEFPGARFFVMLGAVLLVIALVGIVLWRRSQLGA